jgi:hypothetical protein
MPFQPRGANGRAVQVFCLLPAPPEPPATGDLLMADMDAIVVVVNGTSRTFRLLEADIPSLTYRNDGGIAANVPAGRDYIGLLRSIGAEVAAYTEISTEAEDSAPGGLGPAQSIFEPFIRPTLSLAANALKPRPVGKDVLTVAANYLESIGQPFQVETSAVIAISLKGGGLGTISQCGGIANAMVRNSPSAAGKFNYMQSVLAPQILRAAAAAAA